MSALLLSNQCVCCSTTVHPVYHFSDGRCEDCFALACERYDVRGAKPYNERIKGTPDKRRRGKAPADKSTAEWLSNWYSKN
jgi:hypothetical protein